MVKLKQKLAEVKLLVMDVDGVLTDAGMYYTDNGLELKKFNTRDGKGIELIRNIGLKTAILTSENTQIVARRAKKLAIDDVYQGLTDKTEALWELMKKYDLIASQVCYIGDDVNDIEVMKQVGVKVAVADAMKSIIDVAEDRKSVV